MSYEPGDARHTDLEVHRAGPIGDRNVPTLLIHALSPMPEFSTLDEAQDAYVREGEQIADALFSHLPGGVVDQVIAALLLRRASLLRVTFDTEKANTELLKACRQLRAVVDGMGFDPVDAHYQSIMEHADLAIAKAEASS